MLGSFPSNMDAHPSTVRPVETILYVPKKKISSEGSLGYKFLNISSTETFPTRWPKNGLYVEVGRGNLGVCFSLLTDNCRPWWKMTILPSLECFNWLEQTAGSNPEDYYIWFYHFHIFKAINLSIFPEKLPKKLNFELKSQFWAYLKDQVKIDFWQTASSVSYTLLTLPTKA